MRFTNWRSSDTATYLTRKKTAKLHPFRAPSGFSIASDLFGMMAQQKPDTPREPTGTPPRDPPINPREPAPQPHHPPPRPTPIDPKDPPVPQQPPDVPQPRAERGH